MKTIQLDGRKMDDRAMAHRYLRQMFQLPDYYGETLDALYDCLSELRALKVIFVYEGAMLNSLGIYGRDLLQVFLDVAEENPDFVFIRKS